MEGFSRILLRVGVILVVGAAICTERVESAGSSRRHKTRAAEASTGNPGHADCPEKEDPLKFHQIYKGKKIILLDGDRTAVRHRPTSDHGLYGALVTHRSLSDDELFEIRLNETINYDKLGSLSIGVVMDPPRDTEKRRWLCCPVGNEGVWDAFDGRVEKNGVIIKKNYPIRLRNLPVGTHLGVMRKANGDLHFFVNGVDKGRATRNVPQGVFGYFELIKYATVVTITC